MDTVNTPRIGIVGAGISGLCMLALLREAGFTDVVCYEQADEVGGTWRDNTYPGLTCDVPSRFYVYSFAPNPDWTTVFAPGAEVAAYLRRVVRARGLRGHIRFATRVTAARWDGSGYAIEAADGSTDHVDVLVSAVGYTRVPNIPDLPGLDTFAGPCFHSARFDHTVSLRGKRVALVGNGSSGTQLTGALAGVAAPLTLFCRTPQWVLTVPQLSYPRLAPKIRRRLPFLDRLSYNGYRIVQEAGLGVAVVKPGPLRRIMSALCRLNLRLALPDPALRAKLTPPFEPMCKRLLLSAGFFRAVRRPDVHVVTDAIASVEPQGIRTADGTLHEVDAIILATGFDVHAYLRPMRLTGVDGADLDARWAGGRRAYRTVAVPGFPNFFTLVGPHSPIGNNAINSVAETQARYVVRWVRRIAAERIAVAPTEEATEEFNTAVRAALPRTTFATGCESYYLDENGLPEVFPWPVATHRAMLGEPVAEHFTVAPMASRSTRTG